MRTCRVTRWEQLNSTIPWQIALYPGQMGLLSEHAAQLRFLRSTGEESGAKVATVSLTICGECGMWQLEDKQPPKRCQLTIGCRGAPVKVPAAPKASIPAEDHT